MFQVMERRLSRWVGIVSGASLALALLSAGCQRTDTAADAAGGAATAKAAADDPLARGSYLVTIAGCNDCHTPFTMGANGPEPDMARMLSGHPQDFEVHGGAQIPQPWMWAATATNTAFYGPWGVSYSANLTPDEETGVGAWDEDLFMTTIRNGKIHGAGRPIMPPMPWMNYGKMTDDDLKAMFAYLQSIPPIKNKVQEYEAPGGTSGGARP